MAPRRSRRKISQRHQSVLGIIAALVGILVLLVLGYVFFDARSKQVLLNDDDLCPQNGVRGVVAILIDATDQLTAVQRRDIANNLKELRDELATGYLLVAYPLWPSQGELPAPVVRVCNPGRGTELSELAANPRLVEQRWRENFEEPVEQLLNTMMNSGEADTSPIIETIQAISVIELSNPDVADVPRKLIVISDLLQNSDAYSVFRAPIPFPEFKDQAAYNRVRSDLRDIEVDILYVARPGYAALQNKELISFWEQLLNTMGGSLKRIKRISGG